MTRCPRAPRGFTLIELMIAVAVVGILAAVAYPSFEQQVMKTRRSDAKAALLNCAQMLERFSTQSGNYAATADAGVTAACIGWTKNGFYSMPSSNVPASAAAGTFQISAVPSGAQAGDPCGILSFTQDGTKGVRGSLAASACW